ncbi:MAG: hypothetical protein FWPMV1_gp3 [Hangzhou whitmania pigra medionivirus 1]|nr:MAG: hypothetical protein FWPMV1_gp3 [Hangzhou whitmania pigra medionivirus 1]
MGTMEDLADDINKYADNEPSSISSGVSCIVIRFLYDTIRDMVMSALDSNPELSMSPPRRCDHIVNKTKGSPGVPFSALGPADIISSVMSSDVDQFTLHLGHAFDPCASTVFPKKGLEKKIRVRSLVATNVVAVAASRSLYQPLRECMKATWLTGPIKIGCNKFRGKYHDMVKSAYDALRVDSKVLTGLDFPQWDRKLGSSLQMIYMLFASLIAKEFGHLELDSFLSFVELFRIGINEVASSVFATMYFKGGITIRSGGVSSGCGRTADGNSIGNMFIQHYSVLQSLCSYLGNDKDLKSLRNFIMDVKSHGIDYLLLMDRDEFISKFSTIYQTKAASLRVLSDDSLLVLNTSIWKDDRARMMLDLKNTIYMVGHYQLTSDKYWYSDGMSVGEFCSSHSVDVDGVLLPVPNPERIVASLTILPSLNLMRSDIRILRIIALLIEVWPAQFDKRLKFWERSLPIRLLSVAKSLLQRIDDVDFEKNYSGVLELQLLSVIGAISSRSSIERFLDVDELDSVWFGKYAFIAKSWRSRNGGKDLESQKFIASKVCINCAMVSHYTCMDCGYGFCTTNSHLYSHVLDFKHNNYVYAGSVSPVRCVVCRNNDILKLYYDKSEGSLIISCSDCASSKMMPVVLSRQYVLTDPSIMQLLRFENDPSITFEQLYMARYQAMKSNPYLAVDNALNAAQMEMNFYSKKEIIDVVPVSDGYALDQRILFSQHYSYTLIRGKMYMPIEVYFDGAVKTPVVLEKGDRIRVEVPLQSYERFTKLFHNKHVLSSILEDVIKGISRPLKFSIKPSGLNERQHQAMLYALHSSNSMIQGPPGTGKTRVVGELVRQLTTSRERVLCMAASHAGVIEMYNAITSRGVYALRKGLINEEGDGIWRDGLKSPVICMTIQSTVIPSMGKFSTLIIDEVSQVADIDLFYQLQLIIPKRVIFVGDQKQNPTITQSYVVSSEYGNIISFNSHRAFMLTDQYRMSPSIGSFISDMYYDGRLNSRTVEHKDDGIYRVPVPGVTCSDSNGRYYNESELYRACSLVEYLKSYNCNPVILCMYNSVRLRLKKLLPFTDVLTVDAAQGKTIDYVIIVMTKLNYFTQRDHRFNVAVSRARRRVYILYPEGDIWDSKLDAMLSAYERSKLIESYRFSVCDTELGQYFCPVELADYIASLLSASIRPKVITEVCAGNGIVSKSLRSVGFVVDEIEIDCNVASSFACISDVFNVSSFSKVVFANPPFKNLFVSDLIHHLTTCDVDWLFLLFPTSRFKLLKKACELDYAVLA